MKHPLRRYRLSDRIAIGEPDSDNRFVVGTHEDYARWLEQVTWWLASTRKNLDNPKEQAAAAMLAALNGTKLDGNPWPRMSSDFHKRVRQLTGFDLIRGVGTNSTNVQNIAMQKGTVRTPSKMSRQELPPINLDKAMDMKAEYIQHLLEKYPHLENPVYTPKVEELAETVIKGRMLSVDFMTSDNRKLQDLSKIKESLNKQTDELMKVLEISPSVLMRKQQENHKTDVGSLIRHMEQYGSIWEEYERIDSLRELLQTFWQLNNTRPDGTPQLNDWELWHKTRNRPVEFTCRCGETYTLLGGFTPEEIEQACEQAYKVYGFGLERLDPKKELHDANDVVEEIPTTGETLGTLNQKYKEIDYDESFDN